MEFFFKIGAFCLIFGLVALEFRENVKTSKKRAAGLLKVFVISLIFSILCDLTKWLLIMLISKIGVWP